MEFFKRPIVAIILSLALMFLSGVLSTRVKLMDKLDDCDSYETRARVISEIKEDSEKFPGNVFIGCSGIDLMYQ